MQFNSGRSLFETPLFRKAQCALIGQLLLACFGSASALTITVSFNTLLMQNQA